MSVSLTRAVHFRAIHRLHRSDWTAEENRRRFGWTVEPHAHDYRCEVTVSGPLDERLAMVMDLAVLDRLLDQEVVSRLGGKSLHDDIPEFRAVPPTCEAIARDVFLRLKDRLPAGVVLRRVRVAEDPTIHAEWTGDA